MGNFVSVLTYESNQNIQGFEHLDEHVMKKEFQFETIPVVAFKTDHIKDIIIFNDLLKEYLIDMIKKFDIVHITHPMRMGIVVKICKDLHIPTVLTITDNWLLCPQRLLTKDLKLCDGPNEGRRCMSICNYDEKILSRYKDAKFLFDNVDKIFAGCEFLQESFQLNEWKKEINLNTFSMDYSYVKPEKEPDKIVFSFIGSLTWEKGAHVLINAFKKNENKNIKLKIYGSGVEGDFTTARLLQLAKDDKRIEFCGTFNYEDLPTIMSDISVVVIPSTYKEIYPLVMQIGLAYRKPIIASRIGGLPEAVKNGINGYLFDIGNVDQLAKIIAEISANPDLIVKLKQNITDPPRVEEEALKYECVYNELLFRRH
ncbi:MAG: glycosyltransferase [Thaumarchaeota archaeon]|nr:glycosyltransferase [Nitrososphaerota archaeon]